MAREQKKAEKERERDAAKKERETISSGKKAGLMILCDWVDGSIYESKRICGVIR